MNQEELSKILEAHAKWLRGEGGERADLRSADLSCADLSCAKGFFLIPVQDMRGYSFAHGIECEDGWHIRAGCRDLTIAEAKEHWGEKYQGDREQGDMYLYAIEWLEKKLEALK